MFALAWRPQYRKLSWVQSLGPSNVALWYGGRLWAVCGKGSTLLLTWTWPPSCIHSYCPPGLSSPNFKIAGKVTRIWVGCPREIYCLRVVIIMATGNIKTVYDIFQSMESGPTATPTYPIAQVNLLISLAINAWFNCPKVMLWCMLGMFGHFSR